MTRSTSSKAALLVGAAVLALTGCVPGPAPFETTAVREEAVDSDGRVDALVESFLPELAQPVASQRVDYCADISTRAPFQPDVPVYACFVADIRVIEMDMGFADAAAIVDEFLSVRGIEATPYADRAGAVDLLAGGDGVLRAQLGLSASQDLISTMVRGPATVLDTWRPVGDDPVLLDEDGDDLFTVPVSDGMTRDCDCIQWWLVVVDRYASDLRP